jgi:mannan endo-1,4-beta-mannosidase
MSLIEAPEAWLSDIAGYIRSQNQNHLIMDGGHKTIVLGALLDPNIQIHTTHYTDFEMTSFAQSAKRAGKAYIYGEYKPESVTKVNQIAKKISESGATGALIWSLRFRSDNGGFYFHKDFGDLSDSLHYPGFTQTKPKE